MSLIPINLYNQTLVSIHDQIPESMDLMFEYLVPSQLTFSEGYFNALSNLSCTCKWLNIATKDFYRFALDNERGHLLGVPDRIPEGTPERLVRIVWSIAILQRNMFGPVVNPHLESLEIDSKEACESRLTHFISKNALTHHEIIEIKFLFKCIVANYPDAIVNVFDTLIRVEKLFAYARELLDENDNLGDEEEDLDHVDQAQNLLVGLLSPEEALLTELGEVSRFAILSQEITLRDSAKQALINIGFFDNLNPYLKWELAYRAVEHRSIAILIWLSIRIPGLLELREEDTKYNLLHASAQNKFNDTIPLFANNPLLRHCFFDKDSDGSNPAHIAAEKGDESFLAVILSDPRTRKSVYQVENNRVLSRRDALGHNIAHIAARNGHANVLRLLNNDLRDGEEYLDPIAHELRHLLYQTDATGRNIAHLAVQNEHLFDTIIFIYDDLDLSRLMFAVDNKGRNVLMHAISEGNFWFRNFLLANSNARGRYASMVDNQGANAVHFAAKQNNTEWLDEFIEYPEYKALFFAKDRAGNNMLHYGSKKAVVEWVLERAAQVNQNVVINPWVDLISEQNAKGETPLHVMAENNRRKSLKLLKVFHGNVNVKEQTIFHTLVQKGHIATFVDVSKMNLFLLSAVDKHGRNVGHYAAMKGNIIALKHIAKVNRGVLLSSDKMGKNIAHIAAEKGHTSVLDLIEKNQGLKHLLTAKDRLGRTIGCAPAAVEWTKLHLPRLLLQPQAQKKRDRDPQPFIDITNKAQKK